MIAANKQTYDNGPRCSDVVIHARPTASAALAMSIKKTASPTFHPRLRITFDAPGLPEPTVVMSRFFRPATIAALGKVPKKYEITVMNIAIRTSI